MFAQCSFGFKLCITIGLRFSIREKIIKGDYKEMKKLFGLFFAAAMLFSVVFIGANSAQAQVTVRKNGNGSIASRTYRGGKYVYRKAKNGTYYVYRKTASGTKYVGRATYRGGKVVAGKTVSVTKTVGRKTANGTKKVFSKTKKVVVGQ